MIEHNFKKKFGQNFISDKNLLNAIVSDAGINENSQVLEIGAGMGTLTEAISEKAQKVVSYEIDKDLQEHLLGLNLNNVEFVFEDALKQPLEEIEKHFDKNYSLIANLPYYITTPLIFKFLNGSKKIDNLTIMVQKEVAERVVAKCGGKDYGILTIMIEFFGSAKITRIVKRNMFYPVPNVDSAMLKIDIERGKFKGVDGAKFYEFVGGAFSMRRKTLKNNLSKFLGEKKSKLDNISAFTLAKRPEELSIEEFIDLYKTIYQ